MLRNLAEKYRAAVVAAAAVAMVLTGVCEYADIQSGGADFRVSLTRMTAGFAGLSALFGIVIWKHLFQREKQLFGTLRREAQGAAALLEGIYQGLLAGLIFLFIYLVCGKSQSLFIVVFFGIAALIGAVALSHLDISAVCRKTMQYIGFFLLILYTVYEITTTGYTRFSTYGAEVILPVIQRAEGAIHIIGILLMIMQFRTDAQRAMAACVTGVLLYFTWQEASSAMTLEFAMFVLFANLLGRPREIAKGILAVLLIYVGFLAIGLEAGWVEIRYNSFPYASRVPAYGMGHANSAALLMMSILLLVWYLWFTDRPAITLGLCWGAATGIWFLTYSRTVVVLLAVFPAANWIRLQLTREAAGGQRTKRAAMAKYARRMLAVSPLILGVISVMGMYWVSEQHFFSTEGDFFMRFTFPYDFWKQEGFSFFGTSLRSSKPIDNLFLFVLFYFGIAGLIGVCGVLVWAGVQYCQNGQDAELLLLGVFMIYSLMENAVVHLPFGFAALLVGGGPGPAKEGPLLKQILAARDGFKMPGDGSLVA